MHVVLTTIFPPTEGVRVFAEGLASHKGFLWVIGDQPGPDSYDVPACRFYSIKNQRKLGFRLGPLLPERHYSRKNLGYLLMISEGIDPIQETDDDNIPLPDYWVPRATMLTGDRIELPGWCNVYRHFTALQVWPRGFPLTAIHDSHAPNSAALGKAECLIQQGLADRNPDVDAIYRLTGSLPLHFSRRAPVILNRGCWCPFNSQNTTFFGPARTLLYLPSYCSFRMTDIWRSLVAQRCLWEMDSCLGVTSPTVVQERNSHDLLKDFEQEIPGYLHNNRIRDLLESLKLAPGIDFISVSSNIHQCYEHLVAAGLFPTREIDLLEAWIEDLRSLPL